VNNLNAKKNINFHVKNKEFKKLIVPTFRFLRIFDFLEVCKKCVPGYTLRAPCIRVSRTTRYRSSISVPVIATNGGGIIKALYLWPLVRRPSRSQHTLLLHVGLRHDFFNVATTFLQRPCNVK